MPAEWHVLAPDLKFRRNDDGKVIMRIGGEQTYITAERWAAFVAALSVRATSGQQSAFGCGAGSIEIGPGPKAA